jgi:hypothetical protein
MKRCASDLDGQQSWSLNAKGKIKLSSSPNLCLHALNTHDLKRAVTLRRCSTFFDKHQQWKINSPWLFYTKKKLPIQRSISMVASKCYEL